MQASIATNLDTSDDAVVLAIARANPEWELETGPAGEVKLSPLTGTAGSSKEQEAFEQVARWSRVAGGRAFGPSAGFRMPDTSVLGPDAAWLSPAQLASLTSEQTELTFWTVCPAIVIEVLGEWSSWPEVCAKIERYVRYGASFAVAVRPDTGEVFTLGEPPSGFALDFAAICSA